MDASRGPIWFLGDLGDAWTRAIADALSAFGTVERVDCAGPVPDLIWDEADVPGAIVVHRNRWHASDAERARAWRAVRGETAAPLLVLCPGPYLRRDETERWAGLVDWIVPEATADELLSRRLSRYWGTGRGDRALSTLPAFRVEAAGNDRDLTAVLVEMCETAGFSAGALDDLESDGHTTTRGDERERSTISTSTNALATSPHARVLTIWEAPVLEHGWAERLERRARRSGPVIVVAGLLDRGLVSAARSHGAAACLELPCDADDLIDAIAHVAAARAPETWPVPPRFEPPHALPPRRHRRGPAPARERQARLAVEARAIAPAARAPAAARVPPPRPDRGPLPTSGR